MIDRRTFLKSVLASAVAPAFVRAGSLMRMGALGRVTLPLALRRRLPLHILRSSIWSMSDLIPVASLESVSLGMVPGHQQTIASNIELLLPEGAKIESVRAGGVLLANLPANISLDINPVALRTLHIAGLRLPDGAMELPLFDVEVEA